MKIEYYIKNNLVTIFSFLFLFLIIISLLAIFQVNASLIIMIFLIFSVTSIVCFFYDFIRRKNYYDLWVRQLELLDKKYLLPEVLPKATFYEGYLLNETIYTICKKVNEELELYQTLNTELKEYIELWLHEIKIPLATAYLGLHNHSNKEVQVSLKRMEEYLEQVLYYTRSEISEKDYYIRKESLNNIVNQVIKKQKEQFIGLNIGLELNNLDIMVDTDFKWLEFIINQIIQNSIKYRQANLKIIIEAIKENNITRLKISDNGMGIEAGDIKRVFDKTFTGKNGRKVGSSTGIGLYLCKKLCEKLGSKIEVESKVNVGTTVTIIFSENSYFDVLN